MSKTIYTEGADLQPWDDAVGEHIEKNIESVKTSFRDAIDQTLVGDAKSHVNRSETTIQVYGVLKTNERSDIVKLPEIKLRDIYFDSEAPIFEWIEALGKIAASARDISSEENPTEREYRVTLWVDDLYQLRRFLGIGAGHDQIITLLMALGHNVSKEPITAEKLLIIADAMGLLELALNIDDVLVDAFLDKLEDAGLNCMPLLGADECSE